MRRKKGLVLLALLALGAFTITATIGASASASGGAVAAKKKCKKKKARSAKKKKCKKKKGTTPAKISMVRATLTWTGGGSNTDYDLYVFNLGSTGDVSSVRSNTNPERSFSPNASGTPGTETFTDLNFGAHRNYAFGVCKQDGGNDGSSYTIDYVTADGVHHTDTQSGHGDGYAALYNGPPPPTAPNGFAPCPVT
jgi:hypothetical protein